MHTGSEELNDLACTELLESLGADTTSAKNVLNYCRNRFSLTPAAEDSINHTLSDEAFVADWERYLRVSNPSELFDNLSAALIQWNFPIAEGTSRNDSYIAVTRKFAQLKDCAIATGHGFERPETIQLELYPTIAGHIPIISFSTRGDFEYALLALTNRNEPKTLNPNIGAMMVAGYNNLERFNRHLAAFKNNSGAAASNEINRIINEPEKYKDKFILISPGAYSNVSAADLGLSQQEWLLLSVEIRKHHEATHYITQRMYGGMFTHLHDELIADYVGLSGGYGRFRADWFLLFMGIRNGKYEAGSRMEHYVEDFSIDSHEFQLLQEILIRAAQNVETIDAHYLEKNNIRKPAKLMKYLIKHSICELAIDGIASNLVT